LWKTQKEVKKLIAGPGVYICDECIELCNDIIYEDSVQNVAKTSTDNVPKPHEIKEHLDNMLLDKSVRRKLSQLLFIITIREWHISLELKGRMMLNYKNQIFFLQVQPVQGKPLLLSH
jgi:hypothetical protein